MLSTLDRGGTGRQSLQELEVLVRFADQAALTVDLSQAGRRAAALLAGHAPPEHAALAALATRLHDLDDRRRRVAERLVADLAELLAL